MSGNGASPDEMRLAIRGDVQMGAFADALRATLMAPPGPDRAAELVPRLAGAARASLATEPHVGRPGAGQRRRSRLGLIARAGVAVALVLALSAGMAVAGVKLPDAVDAPFEAVGIELPNQSGEGTGGGADSGASDEPGGAGESGEAGAGDVGGEPADPGAGGRENAREHGGKAHGPGGAKPESPGGGNARRQTPHSGKGVGKDGTPPGQANSNAGGQGKGRTEATPPGQAGKPASPGKSDDVGAGTGANGPAGSQGSSKGGGKEK